MIIRSFPRFTLAIVSWGIISATLVQSQEMQLVGHTSLGDFCGYNLNGAGHPGGVGAGPGIPTGIWAYPSCGTQLGSQECQVSPFHMGWFEPGDWAGATYYFDDLKCCEGYKVRNKYQIFIGGAPLSDYYYVCEVY